MSFPRYPEYKDSGVKWLGAVPAHWRVGKARWLTSRYSGGTPDKTNLAYWEDGTIPWLNSGAVNDRLITEPSTYITAEAFANSSAKWIPEGALVIALAGQGKTKGLVAQLAIPSTCNQSMAAIIPGSEVAARFLYWWLESNYQNIRNMAGGDLRDGLNLELLGNIPCPLAPLPEQTQIAAFLDRETAKIDELVAAQRRLMELLKEKRQAVISHAVTKGMNPDAPMKPSGIEWLGDVPAHWEVRPLVRTASDTGSLFIDGDWIESKDLSDEGIRYLTSGNVGEGVYKEQGQGFISQATFDELNCIEVIPGDVLICRLNLPIGRACIVPDLDSRIVTCVDNVIVRPNRCFDRRFFVFLLTSKAHFANMENLARGTTMQRISRSTLGHVRFAFPPFDEQTQIATFLDCETAKIDELIVQAQRAIDLLQERRTALISAAVTGQIDVRQLLPPQKVGAGEALMRSGESNTA